MKPVIKIGSGVKNGEIRNFVAPGRAIEVGGEGVRIHNSLCGRIRMTPGSSALLEGVSLRTMEVDSATVNGIDVSFSHRDGTAFVFRSNGLVIAIGTNAAFVQGNVIARVRQKNQRRKRTR